MKPLQCLALGLALCAALFAPSPAHAEWYEAQSDHFVLYADDDEDAVLRYAENLESYHSALEHFTGRDLPKPSPSNRVTVYAMGSADAVRRLAGSAGVAGFYIPRAGDSVAFIQNTSPTRNRADTSTISLLHEYAHHFLSQTERFAMPLWMNEGAAEFFSTAYFHEDGSVYLGLPNRHRSFTMFWRDQDIMPIEEVLTLDWDRLKGRPAKEKASFYGRSWQLYHYLSTNEEHSGKLRQYWIEVLQGTPSLGAAQNVFGDFGVLERQLRRHFMGSNEDSNKITPDQIAISPIALRPLSEGEVAAMDVRIELARGVDTNRASELADEMRRIANAHPADAEVLSLLAKAEHVSGNDAAAIAAADAALAIDPGQAQAYVQKGLAAFRQARRATGADEKAAAYERAMEPFQALGAMEAEHTVPLVFSYRSYAERGVVPSDSSKQALVAAAELAPFDRELWLIVGMMHMNDGRIDAARAALAPLASNPHGGSKAEQVRNLLVFLSDKQEGQKIDVQAAITAYFVDE